MQHSHREFRNEEFLARELTEADLASVVGGQTSPASTTPTTGSTFDGFPLPAGFTLPNDTSNSSSPTDLSSLFNPSSLGAPATTSSPASSNGSDSLGLFSLLSSLL